MIEIVKYSCEKKSEWDIFVDNSKNGIFMLKRDFVEYHKDRFTDFSLMFYENNKILALLPANIINNELFSHGGLTFGAFIIDYKMTQSKMIEMFQTLLIYLKENNIVSLFYKCIPSIYHLYPADEDLYALFRMSAALTRRDCSSAILLDKKLPFSELRRRCVKKAVKNGLVVRESCDFISYVAALTEVLQMHHGVNPVHNAGELTYLQSCFPDNIKLFCAFDENGIMYAGVILFISEQTVHTQYIMNTEEGRRIGALDLVMDYLINYYSGKKKYFDFGISNENNGLYLNEGLKSQKEMFGGRTIVHDFYTLYVK